ncbi:MAG TPA: hypothetical protein VI790_00800 [Candidatus Nanoarchaeia archaeon]|nr:hypothetical protein [Candidatus Nanoarchaeia archaeon]
MEWYTLFLFLLMPNIMRQLVYLASYKKTKTFGFCVSPETRDMQKKKWLPWAGIIEELGWGSAWTIVWFIFGVQWLAFGWVSDALLDCIIAYRWSIGKKKPKILYAGAKGAFFVREILLPYTIIGPILWALGLDIIVYSIVSATIGIILLKLVK